MERSISIVCRPEIARGFALAGLRAIAASTPEQGASEVAALISRSEEAGIGLILVDEDAYAALPAELQGELRRRALPMVVPIPGPAWTAEPGAAEAYVAEVLGRAVGYRVRLR